MWSDRLSTEKNGTKYYYISFVANIINYTIRPQKIHLPAHIDQ